MIDNCINELQYVFVLFYILDFKLGYINSVIQTIQCHSIRWLVAVCSSLEDPVCKTAHNDSGLQKSKFDK